MAVNRIAWRDAYYDTSNNELVNAGYDVKYVSLSGSIKAGDGSKDNPYSVRRQFVNYISNTAAVLSSGYGSLFVFLGGLTSQLVIGQGMNATETDMHVQGAMAGNRQYFNLYIKDLNLKALTKSGAGATTISNCKIGSIGGSAQNILYSKITGNSWASSSGWNNSFVNVPDPLNGADVLKNNLSIFSGCKISITQDDLNNHKDKYLAFEDCQFKIGNETEYIGLGGTRGFRDDFIRRCVDAGLTVPEITELGETVKLGRWVITERQSTIEGRVIKGSEVDEFQTKRFIKMGYNNVYFTNLPISEYDAVNSFNPNNPMSSGIEIQYNTLRLRPDVSIIDPHRERIASKIIWLGGKNRITGLDLTHNMLTQYGVAIDSTPSLGQSTNEIEPNINYTVRSADDLPARAVYNNVEYTSALSGNNILRGIDGVKSCTQLSDNARIYPVLDYAAHRTVRMRVVDDVPPEQIRTGSLLPGYWYMVVPDWSDVTFGYVDVGKSSYGLYDSFLAANGVTFKIRGSVHLRRCWRHEDAGGNNDVDKDYWRNKQSPKWCEVVMDDMRCLMKRNAASSGIMQTDAEGNYITSGHPLFYNSINGDSGAYVPAYPISGSYVQFELEISTLNPM